MDTEQKLRVESACIIGFIIIVVIIIPDHLISNITVKKKYSTEFICQTKTA